jgi:predicted cobalt transporter CbtA
MVRGLLIRGMLAGLAAGVLAFMFAKVFGEPQVDKAIAFEEATSPSSSEAPLVSRGMQSTPGLLTGTVVYATALGGIFALAFAAVWNRAFKASPRATAAVLAVAGFVVIFLVPFTKYPSNPPAVGNDDTIGYRTKIFFVMLAISIFAAVAALRLGRDFVRRFGGWNGVLAAVGAFIALVAIGQLLMPALDEIPKDFPTSVIWHFRVATVGIHAVIWATLGLVFGWLAAQQIGVEHPALAGTGLGAHPHDLVGDLAQAPRDQDLVGGA